MKLTEIFNIHSQLSTNKRIDGMSKSYKTFLAHYIGEYESMCDEINKNTFMQYLANKSLAASTKAALARGIGKFLFWNDLISDSDVRILNRAFRMPVKSWSEGNLTTEQVEQIITISRKKNTKLARYRDSSIIVLLSTIGCRVGQAVDLKSKDIIVDSNTATLHLKRQKERRKDINELIDTKQIPLDISIGKWNVGNILNQYLDFRYSKFTTHPDSPLFLSESANGISVRYMQKMIEAIGKQMDMKLYPHLFRHYVGHSIANNQGLLPAAAMLGHSNINTTAKYVNPKLIDTKEILQCQYQKHANTEVHSI